MKKPYDKLLKMVADRLGPDGIRFLLPGCTIGAIEPLPEEVPGRKESQERSVIHDRLFRLITDQGPRTLILEYLARYRSDTPARMLAYAARALQHWRTPVEVVVVALDGPDDPVAELSQDAATTRLQFSFHLLCLWQMEADSFLNECPVGLVPLAGAMADISPELLLRATRRIMEKVTDDQKRRELLDCLTFLAARRLEIGKIRTIIAKETGMSDLPWVDKILEEGKAQGLLEGREEGLEKGREEGLEQGLEKGLEQGLEQGLEKGLERGLVEGRLGEARQSVLDTLEVRFSAVPANLPARLEGIADLDQLTQLRREAVRCPDLNAFLQKLP